MNRGCQIVLLLCAVHAASAVEITLTGPRYGRLLKEITAAVNASTTTLNLTVSSSSSADYTYCNFRGAPGNGSAALGPLVLKVPSSISTVKVLFPAGTKGGSAVALYDNTTNVNALDSADTGLTTATWTRDSTSTSFGYVTGGLIQPFDPSSTTGTINADPKCFVNVTFVSETATAGPPPDRLAVNAPAAPPSNTESNGTAVPPAVKAAQPSAQVVSGSQIAANAGPAPPVAPASG